MFFNTYFRMFFVSFSEKLIVYSTALRVIFAFILGNLVPKYSFQNSAKTEEIIFLQIFWFGVCMEF